MEKCYISTEQISTLLGPSVTEIWLSLHHFLRDQYHLEVIWNDKTKYAVYEIKYKTAGKTLCTLLLREKMIECVLIFGRAEREVMEEHRKELSNDYMKIYDETESLHDGKWVPYPMNDKKSLDAVKQILPLKKKPNSIITVCGYCCDRCKANCSNIKKKDERENLSAAWKKYYGFYVAPEDCSCDGCMCKKTNAHLIDAGCPVRKCHVEQKVAHCYECSKYPCETFMGRKGYSSEDAKKTVGDAYDEAEYEEFLEMYDNYSRNERLRKKVK